MNSIFHRFETSSRAEREEMADNLKRHYNHMIQLERDAFAALRDYRGHAGKVSRSGLGYTRCQISHAETIAALGHVQTVFDILGIDHEPGQPFDLGLF